MKKLIIILSLVILVAGTQAQTENKVKYQYNHKSVYLDVDYVYDKVDVSFVDTLKKHYRTGMYARNKIATEAIRIFGQERFNQLSFYLDSDTMLNYSLGLLNSTLRVESQKEFVQKLYNAAHPLDYNNIIGDTLTGWNSKNGINVGICVGLNHLDSTIIIIKKDGDPYYLDPFSISISTQEEINNYY